MTKPEKMLRRVRLELARDHEFPDGSRERGYDFIAPLDAKGHIDLDAWKALRDRCRVRRFWGYEREEIGHIVHKRGNVWAFHYDIHGDPVPVHGFETADCAYAANAIGVSCSARTAAGGLKPCRSMSHSVL